MFISWFFDPAAGRLSAWTETTNWKATDLSHRVSRSAHGFLIWDVGTSAVVDALKLLWKAREASLAQKQSGRKPAHSTMV